MYFLTSHTKAQFYNNSRITFLVRNKSVDLIFKIKRGTYTTVNISTLSNERLLLVCNWDNFFNRLQNIKYHKGLLNKLRDKCPSTYKALTSKEGIHLAFLDTGHGAIVLEIKAPILSNNISDFLHENVIENAIKLMSFNLKIQEEIEENCPFPVWKHDLQQIIGL